MIKHNNRNLELEVLRICSRKQYMPLANCGSVHYGPTIFDKPMTASAGLSVTLLTGSQFYGIAGAIAALLSITTLPTATQAQIMPDTTLGDENSTVTPDAIVRGDLADLIEGGAARDGNLFHSFLEFNVAEGQRVYFANPEGIKSILSRVTGGDLSNIFGVLGVDGAADLFLLNPNSIVFGENATLDIAGSFYATTAAAIELGDEVFSATEPERSRLLTVSPSILFENYLSDTSGNIENQGQIVADQNLTLAANRLDLQGQIAAGGDLTLSATDEVLIRDTADVPFVALAGGDLLVQGNEQVDIMALSHPDSGLYSYGNMVLRSANQVGGDAHYWSAGDFRVERLDGSGGELFSPIDPIIRAFGDVEFEVYLGSSLHILAGGSVTIGTAIINAPDPDTLDVDFLQEVIELSDGTIVAIDGGAQPTLDVRAGVRPDVIGVLPIENPSGQNPATDLFFALQLIEPTLTDIPSRADIIVGDIGIDAPNGVVLLTNHYEPNTALAGGDIRVTGEGLRGFGIDAGNLVSRGGAVFLDARSDIAVVNSAIGTTGLERVGDIVLTADGTVTFDGSDGARITGAFAFFLATGGKGIGGNVRINASNLEVLNGAQINSVFFGNNGQGGDIILDIHDAAHFIGSNSINGVGIASGASSDIGPNGEGRGGNVEIRANTLEVLDGARLSTSNFGKGEAGNVILGIADTARFVGFDFIDGTASGVLSRIEINGEGRGGNIEIYANTLEVLDGARLSTSNLGKGEAGSVILEIVNTAQFIGFNSINGIPSGASSTIQPDGEGRSGNVEIRANTLEVFNGAQLDASTFGEGEAGNVILEIADTAYFVGSTSIGGSPSGAFSNIVSNGKGRGGNVEIRANTLEVLGGAQLRVGTSGEGDAGSMFLEIADTARFVGSDIDGRASGAFSNVSGAFSQINSDGQGQGGKVEIRAANLEVLQEAILSAISLGIGNAGEVILVISDQILVDDGVIRTNSENDSGGQVNIRAGNVILRNDGDIQSFVSRGEGEGGNITIIADFVIALEDSDILAFSADGRGGAIDLSQTTFFSQNLNLASENLSREELLALDGNDRVDINATGGISSGQISINDASFIENSLSELSGDLVNTETITAGSCITRTGDTEGSFVVTGGEGLPQQPGGSAISAYPTGAIQTMPETDVNQPIQEPEGIYQLADGRLVLSHECGL